MIGLVMSVCLALHADVCAERMLPRPGPETVAQCQATAADRVKTWAAGHPDLTVASWACRTPTASPLAVTEVAPGLWVHEGRYEEPTTENLGDLANIGFVVGDKSVAVIDAGGSRQVAERLLSAIRKVTDLPVRTLVLTHMHPDHVMGASLFVDMGAEIVGHPHLSAALKARAATYEANYARLIGDRAMILSKVIDPDRIRTDVESLDLGGRALALASHPTAHTDNDLTVFDPKTGTIWMADLVFARHVPALDGSIRGWLALLDGMRNFPAKRLVPGHGPPALPFPDGMDATRDYLVALAGEVRDAIARGESMSAAIRHVGKDLGGDWLLFDAFNARNATAAYAELEWE